MATDKKIPSNLIFNKEKFRYNTIQDVINDTGLTVGLVVETDGYNTLGDGFDAKYLITNVNEQGSILLKNGYYAKEISNSNGSKKLNQGNVSTDYDTAEKMESKIKEKLEKGNASTEYDTAKKIEDKIKEAQGTADNKLNKGSLPATVPDGKAIYDLLENNGGINIDPNLLYLNDAGTKTQGKVYFDRNKKGLFECVQTTTATTNSTTYFVDISNKASADRLTNLVEDISSSFTKTHAEMSIRKIEAYLLNKKIVLLSVAIDTGSHNLEKNEKVLQNNKFNFKDMEFNCTTWNDTNLSTTSYIECSNNLFNTKATISSYRRFAFSGVLHIK